MLFDLGVGLIIAALVDVFQSSDPEIGFYLFGALAALSPDLDMPIWLLRTRGRLDRWAHRHRDLLHYPLFFIPGGALLFGWFFGSVYGLVFALASFAHFFHDSFNEGWGIRWFWPFSKRYFKLERENKTWALKRWTRTEQDALAALHGDDNWAQRRYARLSPSLVVEIGFLIIAVGFLLLLV
jgi:membrane-bound metal-dependent hydrolase YbcI (DUF457 family)